MPYCSKFCLCLGTFSLFFAPSQFCIYCLLEQHVAVDLSTFEGQKLYSYAIIDDVSCVHRKFDAKMNQLSFKHVVTTFWLYFLAPEFLHKTDFTVLMTVNDLQQLNMKLIFCMKLRHPSLLQMTSTKNEKSNSYLFPHCMWMMSG